MIGDSDDDQLYRRACEYVVRGGRPSVSVLQRHFKVGFYQASRWIERMMENGIITPPRGSLH
jgi:DNA segregation ATPase FtsK/SpoIIIE-like protein